MYKVMIVDDEIFVRIGLKSSIEWEKLGYTIVAEASNGEQAFEAYNLYKPEVVLTDIRMPKKDGLWLTEMIKKENPNTKILILSCYDEFSFAREALKLGASNYILKSEVEDDDLITIMKEIKQELDAEYGRIERFSYLQHQITSNINILKENLLNDLITTKLSVNDEFKYKCRGLDFQISNTQFLLAIIYRNDIEKKITYSNKDWQLMNFAIINIATEIFNEHNLSFLVCPKEDRFIFLLSKNPIFENDLEIILDRVRNMIIQYLDINISIALSNKFSNIEKTQEVYEECNKKSQLIFYNYSSMILESNKSELGEIKIVEVKENFELPLLNYLEEENTQKTLELVEKLESFFTQKCIIPFQVKLFYSNLVTDIIERYNVPFSGADESADYSQYAYKIMNLVMLKDVSRLLKEFLIIAIKAIELNRVRNSNNIVHKSIEYINKNYNEDISLQSMSQYLNLSKHYVCYIFKRETGENISTYINNVRIENAKLLLKKFNYKAKEIYDKVGFSDQQYFCKTFKKVTGMTVIEYRDSILKKNREN